MAGLSANSYCIGGGIHEPIHLVRDVMKPSFGGHGRFLAGYLPSCLTADTPTHCLPYSPFPLSFIDGLLSVFIEGAFKRVAVELPVVFAYRRAVLHAVTVETAWNEAVLTLLNYETA